MNMLALRPGGVFGALGAVCDPKGNPPIPSGIVPWSQSGVRLTPEIQQWASRIANDLTVPIGSIHKRWFGNVPVVGIVLCHDYTVLPDGSKRYGAYHGVTVFYPVAPEMMPPHENGFTKQPAGEDGIQNTFQYILFATVIFSATFAATHALFQGRKKAAA